MHRNAIAMNTRDPSFFFAALDANTSDITDKIHAKYPLVVVNENAKEETSDIPELPGGNPLR